VAAPEILFVVGEPSGDLHAAQLAEELRRRGDFRLTGAGGPRMRAAGVKTDFDSSRWGAIGVADALRKVPALYLRKLDLLRLLRRRRPALLIYMDFGAFNVRLARAVRQLPFRQPTMYYFPPASWDRSARDRSPLAALVDVVATPFPWSEQLLRQDGVPAHFVGHPVLDRLAPAADQAGLRRDLGLPPAAHYLGLLPGSRPVERRLLGPQMLRAARELIRDGGYHFLWSSPPGAAAKPDVPDPSLAGHLTVIRESADIFRAADLVLTSFGTATLEAAAALCPMLTMYRGTWAMRLQYRLMRIPTAYYAMPNIILQRELVPELIQDEATGPRLAARVRELIAAPEALSAMRDGLREVRLSLGEPGAARRTADLVLQALAPPAGSEG
jgi:lipid-A-disaccharide synthase